MWEFRLSLRFHISYTAALEGEGEGEEAEVVVVRR